MIESFVFTLFRFMDMHFDLIHTLGQIKLSLACIYSRDMATIFVGNLYVWASRCQVNMCKFKCGDITKVALSDEVDVERLG